MGLQLIDNVAPGDSLKVGADKINDNFGELYARRTGPRFASASTANGLGWRISEWAVDGLATAAALPNQLVLFPFRAWRDGSISTLAVNLSSAATAAVGIRLGVYNTDDDGLPSTKLGELASPIAVANGQAAGVLSGALAVNAPVEEGRLYYTAFVCDAAGVTLSSVGVSEAVPISGVDHAFAKNTKMHRAFPYAALPADEGTLGVTDYTYSVNGANPVVGWRFA